MRRSPDGKLFLGELGSPPCSGELLVRPAQSTDDHHHGQLLPGLVRLWQLDALAVSLSSRCLVRGLRLGTRRLDGVQRLDERGGRPGRWVSPGDPCPGTRPVAFRKIGPAQVLASEKSLVPCLVRLHDLRVTGVPELRFYGDLASWWPLISPVDEYVEEAGLIAQLLGSAAIPVREVLELGSGGGSNAAHLKQQVKLTLVDLSPEMLEVSQRLNPECVHQQGDMRTVRLGREFDAVFVHDAVGYMTSEEDLAAAARTAFLHCRPGGVAVFVPDEIRETYEPGTEQGGTDGPDGRGVRFLEWSWDPDPADTTTVTQYVFVLRDPGNAVQVVHEEHRFGLFNRQTWVDILTAAGFQVEVTHETTNDDRTPREVFLANRPVT